MKKILFVALAAVGMTACVQNEELAVAGGNTAIAFGDAYVYNATKADPTTTTASISSFDVWAFMDEVGGTVLTDEDVTKVNGVWGYSNLQYWAPNHTYYFAALSPANTTNITSKTLAAGDAAKLGLGEIAYTNPNGEEDLLYAKATAKTLSMSELAANGMPAVAMQFQHLLSKVKFTFKNGFLTDNMKVVVTNVRMTAPKSATINLAQADYSEAWVLGAEDLTLAFGNVAAAAQLESGAKASTDDTRLTIPASAAEEYTVTFDVVVYSGTVEAFKGTGKQATIKGYELAMGKAYNFTAVINADSFGLQPIKFTAEVDEWDTEIEVPVATYTPVENVADLESALKAGEKYISVAAGEYTFPANLIQAGTTIHCAEGTIFTGKSSLNINGATVIGATFKNEGGQAAAGTIYGTFKNCTFEGEESLRWCYSNAGKPVVFENCVIKNDFRGVHFDGMDGDVLFKNCELNGFNAYGGEGTATFEGCTFGTDSRSSYNGLNIYANTVLTDCTFIYKSGKTNFIDMEATGKSLTITNCTATLDGAAADVADYVGGSKVKENTIIIDGEYIYVPGYDVKADGYYAIGNTYTVVNGKGYKTVATTVLADGSKNVVVELAKDIDLAGIEWPAVMTAATFVLDGKGHAIKNLTTSAVESHGFFSTAMFTTTRKAATIKDLVVENATVTGRGGDNSHGAVLVACNYASLNISGVTVKGSTISNCDRTGGLVAYLYFAAAKVENCVVEGCTINSIGTVGAILGYNNGNNFEMTNCKLVNTTTSSSEGNNKAGLFIGTWAQSATLTKSGNTHTGSKAINAGVETNNEIGRLS